MNVSWWKEKRLRTVWRVEKGGTASFLVGTAHFTPYRFRKALTKLIQNADTILFEGPSIKRAWPKWSNMAVRERIVPPFMTLSIPQPSRRSTGNLGLD